MRSNKERGNKTMITNARREGTRSGLVLNPPDPVKDTEIGNVVNDCLASCLVSCDGSNTATTTATREGESPRGRLTGKVEYPYASLALPNLMGGGDANPCSVCMGHDETLGGFVDRRG